MTKTYRDWSTYQAYLFPASLHDSRPVNYVTHRGESRACPTTEA